MHMISKDPSKLEDNDSEFDVNTKVVLNDKLSCRKDLADKFSLIKLNYILSVLRKIYGSKVTMSDPEAFKDKVRRIEKRTSMKAKFER